MVQVLAGSSNYDPVSRGRVAGNVFRADFQVVLRTVPPSCDITVLSLPPIMTRENPS